MMFLFSTKPIWIELKKIDKHELNEVSSESDTITEISLASLQYHFTIISNFQYYITEEGAILELHTISSSKNLLFFFFLLQNYHMK